MKATDSFLVPLVDAGRLSGLKGGPLGFRFRFWRDQDGQRHVFSVYPADDAPDYPDALAIVARRTPAGPIAMWAGPAGEPARAAASRFRAEEVHIFILSENAPASLRRLRDPALPAVRETQFVDSPPVAPAAPEPRVRASFSAPRASRRAA